MLQQTVFDEIETAADWKLAICYSQWHEKTLLEFLLTATKEGLSFFAKPRASN